MAAVISGARMVLDLHLSFVHGEKLNIKQETDSQPSVIYEAKELEVKHQGEENTQKNESKRRKVSMKTASGHKGKEKIKCEINKANFGQKGTLSKHILTVHEGKKQFKCGICNSEFTSKWCMKGHFVTTHEGSKQF